MNIQGEAFGRSTKRELKQANTDSNNTAKCSTCTHAVNCTDAQIYDERFVKKTITLGERDALEAAIKIAIDQNHVGGEHQQQIRCGHRIATVIKTELPRVAQLLDAAKCGVIDAVYIKGFPTEPDVARNIMLGLSSLLGDLFNYDQQNDGKILMELRPAKGSESNTNSTADHFGLHSDDAAVPRGARTEFISLYGLENPPNTLTGFAPTLEALDSMRTDQATKLLVGKLSERDFQVRMPVSFGLESEVWSEPCALVTIDESGDVETRFPSYAVRPINDGDLAAHAAIAAFHGALRGRVVSVPLDPGCFLTFNNNRGCHERGTIGKGDRLILRTYSTSSIEYLREVTGVDGPVFPITPIMASLDS